MRHRALFLAILLGLALLLGVTACQQLEQTVQAMQPEVRGVTLEWGEVTPQSAEFTTTLLVYNPSPISLPVKRVTSEIFMDGIPMGSAETLDLRIEKQAEFPIRVSARIDNTKIPAFWAEHIRRQEKSEAQIDTKATFDLGLTDFTFPFRVKRPITTDLLSPLSRMEPIRVEQAVRLPGAGGEAAVFRALVKSVSAQWGAVTEASTEVNLSAVVRNDNPYPLSVPGIAYHVDISGLALASGEAPLGLTVAPGAEAEVNTTVTLDTGRMGEWFASHIRNGERSTFSFKVSLVLDLPPEVAGQVGQERVLVPVWEGTQTFETSILGGR